LIPYRHVIKGGRVMKRPAFFLCPFTLGLVAMNAAPADARDALGMFGAWGAFRDAGIPRCYAIAMPEKSAKHEVEPYADVGIWPKKGLRGQVHFRLSHRTQPGAAVQLALAGQHFRLMGGGADAWAADERMQAAIMAAMRSGEMMTVSSRDGTGRLFADQYALPGAATAMDAAALGCAQSR
jgi:hypothetical protein